MYSISDMLMN